MDEKLPSASVDDQRRSARESVAAPVKVTFDGRTIRGVSDNISAAGILCLTEDSLRVTVEIDLGDRSETRTGRLVRVNRVGTENTGLAIEFDTT